MRVTVAASLVGLSLSSACTDGPGMSERLLTAPPVAAAPIAPPAALPPVPTLPPHDRFRYDVVATDGATDLLIEASFPEGGSDRLSIDPDAEPFVSDLSVFDGDGWQELPSDAGGWRAGTCPDGCRLRYRFRLLEAARALDHEGWAAARAGAIFSPPSTWLVYPARAAAAARYAFRVRSPDGMSFVTGVFRSADGFGYEAEIAELPLAPFSAFGALRTHRRSVGGSVIETAYAKGDFDAGFEILDRWVTEAAQDVVGLYGRFPVPSAQVLIIPTRGSRVGFSRALGYGGASVLSPVGTAVPEETLKADWQMTHEMLHLGFPNLGDDHAWLEEGIATYVEPILRARRGRHDARKVWSEFYRSMPFGQPAAGDRGLDHTPTWGRTYWGGAMFCLVADVEIRRRSGGSKSLDDALRSIADAGGNVSVRWSIDETLRIGDEATGLDVLSSLYARHGERAEMTDLHRLFSDLGVSVHRGAIVFDDEAPLASVRRSITDPGG